MTTRRNLTIAFGQKTLQTSIAITSVIVLSRLVSPAETGIFSTGIAIAAITHSVRDFGVGNFLIKEQEPTAEKVRTAFTISLLIAVGISMVLFAAALPIARFYGQPKVAWIIAITTVGLLISPFATVNMALLLRDHRFFDIFKISISANFAGAAVSILCAWRGMGAVGLATGSLASSFGLVVVANIVLPRWQDYLPSLSHWRPIFRFGLHSALSGVSEQIGGRVTDVILGKTIGFAAVGILSRSGSIISMFLDAIMGPANSVIMADMASDARQGGSVIGKLLTSIEYSSAVAWPFFAVLVLFARDATSVLFGAQWLEAVPYTRIQCLSAALGVLLYFTGIAATATGRVDLLARYNLVSQSLRVLLVGAGALYSLMAVVWMMVLATALQCVIAYITLHPIAPVKWTALRQRMWRSGAVTIIVLAAVFPIYLYVNYEPILRIFIVAVAATVSWLVALIVVGHPGTELLYITVRRALALLELMRMRLRPQNER